MFRSDLTDEQWQRIRPVLPPQKPKTGRPALDHRGIVNAILYVQNEGVAWRHLPPRFGSWSTVACRYYRWKSAGIWDGVMSALTNDGALPRDLLPAHAGQGGVMELIQS